MREKEREVENGNEREYRSNKFKWSLRDCGKKISLFLIAFHVLLYSLDAQQKLLKRKNKFIQSSNNLWSKILMGCMTQEKNEQREQNNTSQWIGIEHWPFLISGSKTCFFRSYFIFIWLNVFIWKQKSKLLSPFSYVTSLLLLLLLFLDFIFYFFFFDES